MSNQNPTQNQNPNPFYADLQKIIKASASGGSPNMGPGKWLVSLGKPFIKPSENGPKRFFIVPFTTVATTNPDTKPGDCPSWKPDITAQSGPSNVKAFLLAVGQSLWEDFDQAASEGAKGVDLLNAIMEGEYVTDMLMLADAFLKETRAGGQFTVVNWLPYDREVAVSWFGEENVPAEDEVPS